MIFGAILGLAGGLIGAFGKKKEGEAGEEAAKANAKQIRARTDIELTLSRRQGEKGIGATEAAFGAAGVKLGGSASDVLRESRRDIAFQSQSIAKLGKLEAEATEAGGAAAKKSGNIGFAGGLFSAAANLF